MLRRMYPVLALAFAGCVAVPPVQNVSLNDSQLRQIVGARARHEYGCKVQNKITLVTECTEWRGRLENDRVCYAAYLNGFTPQSPQQMRADRYYIYTEIDGRLVLFEGPFTWCSNNDYCVRLSGC